MSRRVNRDDTDRFHDYSLHIPTRTIYMGSEHVRDEDFEEAGVEATMAERQIKNLHILDMASDEPITILMNNPGGDVNHGLAIFDAIKTCRSKISIKVFGNAASMGSVLLQAADERIMAPNAVQMIHYGLLGASGHAKTIYKITAENKRLDKWMEEMYLEKIKEKQPHFTLQRLKGMLEHDTFLTAQQSIELGLADKILD